MDPGRNNLLEALKQVERRTESGASGWRLLIYALILAPVGSAAPLLLFRGDVASNPVGPFLVITLCLSALILSGTLGYTHEVRRTTRRKLEASNLTLQLVQLSDDRIFEATPWPWRLTLPGLRRDDKKTVTTLQRVAWNLDWYLAERTRNFRAQWIAVPLLLTVLFIYIGAFYVPMHLDIVRVTGWRYALPSWHDWEYHAFPIMLLTPIAVLYLRRQIWTEELVRHLRERLEA